MDSGRKGNVTREEIHGMKVMYRKEILGSRDTGEESEGKGRVRNGENEKRDTGGK